MATTHVTTHNQIGVDDGNILPSSPTVITKTHTHTLDSIVGMEYMLTQKADTGHVHLVSDIPGLATEIANMMSTDSSYVSKTELTNGLSTKSAAIHGHALSDVNGLMVELGSLYKKPLTGIPVGDLSPDLVSSISTISTTNSALAGLKTTVDTISQNLNITDGAVSYGYSKPSEGIPVSDLEIEIGQVLSDATITKNKVSQLELAIATKSNSQHIHTISEINGLQNTLSSAYVKPVDGIPLSDMVTAVVTAIDNSNLLSAQLPDITSSIANLNNSKANISHTHIPAEIDQLDLLLSAKSQIGHTHAYSEFVGLSAVLAEKYVKPTTGIPKADLAPTIFSEIFQENNLITRLETVEGILPNKSATAHNHEITNISNLDTILLTKYEKPVTGIPEIDLGTNVQEKLTKISTIETAVAALSSDKYTTPLLGIPKIDMDMAVKSSLSLADTSVQPGVVSGIGFEKNVRIGVLSFLNTATTTSQIISTRIPVNSQQMVKLNFDGYSYGASEQYSFSLVFYTYNNPATPTGSIYHPSATVISGISPKTINMSYIGGYVTIEIIWKAPIYFNRYSVSAFCGSPQHTDDHYKNWTVVADAPAMETTNIAYTNIPFKRTPLVKEDSIIWSPSTVDDSVLDYNNRFTVQTPNNDTVALRYRGNDGIIRTGIIPLTESTRKDSMNHYSGLVLNGSGTMRSNYGFSKGQYDFTNSPPGFDGSFKFTESTQDNTHATIIKVDPGAVYEMSAYVMSPNGAKCYLGLSCLDSDFMTISSQNVKTKPGTMTTLAAPLSPTDTTVTVTNASAWSNDSTSSSPTDRIFGIFAYKSSTGKQYNPSVEPYTRLRGMSNQWDAGGITGNVITLNAPLGLALANPAPSSNGIWPIGTPIGQMANGGGYVYRLAGNYSVPTTWTRLSALIGGGIDTTGADSTTLFRPGTQYVQFVVLSNWGTTSEMNVAGVYFNRTSLPRSAVV